MPNHTITQTGQVVQCAACGWRCILTTQGPFIRDAGDPAVDHLAAQQAQRAERRAYVEQLIDRFRARYDARVPMPDGSKLERAQALRLHNAIVTEHEL